MSHMHWDVVWPLDWVHLWKMDVEFLIELDRITRMLLYLGHSRRALSIGQDISETCVILQGIGVLLFIPNEFVTSRI